MPTPSTPLPSLPTDADALRTLLLASWAERDSLAAERDDLATQNDRLRHLLLQLKRLQFGTRSERLPEEQLQLGLEAVEQAIARDQAEAEHRDGDLKRERRAKRRANRGALPAHLPRIEVTLAPEDTACPCCRAAMTVIGEDSSERLDVIPAQFQVIVTRRPKFACRACAGTVVQLPAPARLIEGGIPTEALVAHVLVSRYADHLPLYRQAQIMARQGVALDRSTLAFWTGYAAAEIAPVVAQLREMLLASTRLFADETVVPVLDPGRGRTKKGYFWAELVKVPPAKRVEYQRRGSRAMTGPGAGPHRPRWSTATHRDLDTSMPRRCSGAIAAFCNAMDIKPTRLWPILAEPRVRSHSAGAMSAGDSTIWPKPVLRRSPAKRWRVLPPCIGSRPRFAARPPNTGSASGKSEVEPW
jgi:transposase